MLVGYLVVHLIEFRSSYNAVIAVTPTSMYVYTNV